MQQLPQEQLKKLYQIAIQLKEHGLTDDPRYIHIVQVLQAHSNLYRQQAQTQSQPTQPAQSSSQQTSGSQQPIAQGSAAPNASGSYTQHVETTANSHPALQYEARQALQQQRTKQVELTGGSAVYITAAQISTLVEQINIYKTLCKRWSEMNDHNLDVMSGGGKHKDATTEKNLPAFQSTPLVGDSKSGKPSILTDSAAEDDATVSSLPPQLRQREAFAAAAMAQKLVDKRNLGTQWKRGKFGLTFLSRSSENLPVPAKGFLSYFRRGDGSLPVDLEDVKLQRDKIVAQLIRAKALNLQAKVDAQVDEGCPASQQDLLALKSLKLLGLQKQIRLAVVDTHQQALLALKDPTLVDRMAFKRYKKQSRKEIRLYEKEQRRKQTEIENARRQRHQNFIRAVCNHSREFSAFHRNKYSNCAKAARGVKAHLEALALKAEREEDRLERNRLKALKANDMESYAKLVEQAKNKRLQYLLKQTDEYLDSIKELVRRQQSETGESGNPEGFEEANLLSTQGDYYDFAHTIREDITRQPAMLVGGDLKEYQLKGLQWMVSLYNNNLNGILADEMGLGKTIQTIALISYLMEVKHNNGPFLIVVPLSTLSNWVNEFAKWAPSAITVVYKGTPQVRKDIFREEMASGKFNVLLTTYEYVMKDKHVLRRISWQYTIVDEGHRMKNAQSKFAQTLGQLYTSKCRMLLTGTPLQNNLSELWSLLNFLLPKIFMSADNFEQWFNKPFQNYSGTGEGNELNEEEKLLIINRLHQVLRPFLLRREKASVIDQLPNKVEKVLRCELSAWQKAMYRQIQEKGALLVDPTTTGAKGSSRGLSNIIMQLRKVCNHPYLFSDDGWPIDEEMIRSSGKFDLLDRMLPKLKAAGHRVLMFSQMTQLMNILEDYFSFRGFKYLRLDGSTASEEREQRMFQFNEPDSPYFIFLLSTRAGGLGLNLATADTVILFDSDWNPMMDAQAQDRAHRIGQKNEVRVFRLITNSPIEEKILARATDKLNINSLVVEAGKFNTKSKDAERRAMLETLLRVESDESNEESEGVVDDDQINMLMAVTDDEYELYQRMDHERQQRDELDAKQTGGLKRAGRLMQENELPEWLQPSQEDLEMDDETRARLELEEFGRGTRKRKEVAYNDGMTDRQFARLVEEGGDVAEFINNPLALRQMKKKKRVRNDIDSSGERPSKFPKTNLHDEGSNMRDSQQISRKALKIYKAIIELKDESGRSRCMLYMEKPSRAQYQDYYKIIKDPIDLKTIHKKIKKHQYGSVEQFEHDMMLMFNNARLFNMPNSLVYQDADEMEKLFRSKLRKFKSGPKSSKRSAKEALG